MVSALVLENARMYKNGATVVFRNTSNTNSTVTSILARGKTNATINHEVPFNVNTSPTTVEFTLSFLNKGKLSITCVLSTEQVFNWHIVCDSPEFIEDE